MSKKISKNKYTEDVFYNVLSVLPKNDQYNAIRSNMIKRYEPVKTCEKHGICKTCGRFYSQIPQKCEIVPYKKPNRFLKRLLRKSSNNSDRLKTPYQMSSFKKSKKLTSFQTLLSTCQFCKFTSKNTNKRLEKEKPVQQLEEIKNTIKKSRKTSVFAGLNKNAVLSVKRKIESVSPKVKGSLKKKKKLDKSVNMQLNNSTNLNEGNSANINENDIVETIDNSIIYIDKTPAKKALAKQPEIINLITPRATVINLATPSASIINLVTPTAKKKNQNSSLKGLSSKKKGKSGTQKKKANKIIASSDKKTGKSNKKLNYLQNILNDNEKNKSVSNLTQFLKSVS